MEKIDDLRGLCCGITGAGGYLGSVLTRSLRNVGAQVVELTRNPSSNNPSARRFRLGESTPPETFCGIDLLIHGAYDFAAYGWQQIHATNVEGTQKLFADASNAGVSRFLLISTISAFPGSRSQYGKAKLEMEEIAARYKAAIIRPGLIYGPELGGMMGSLAKLVALPVLTPMLGSGRFVQYTAHEEDLSRLIQHLAATPDSAPSTPITAANDTGYTLREIMRMLVRARNKRELFFPVPVTFVRMGLVTLETVGLRPRMRSDSLVSLLNQNPHPDFSSLQATGVSFRPLTLPLVA